MAYHIRQALVQKCLRRKHHAAWLILLSSPAGIWCSVGRHASPRDRASSDICLCGNWRYFPVQVQRAERGQGVLVRDGAGIPVPGHHRHKSCAAVRTLSGLML